MVSITYRELFESPALSGGPKSSGATAHGLLSRSTIRPERAYRPGDAYSGGIGCALAKGMAEAGAVAVVNGRARDKVDAVVAQIEAAGGRAHGAVFDVDGQRRGAGGGRPYRGGNRPDRHFGQLPESNAGRRWRTFPKRHGAN